MENAKDRICASVVMMMGIEPDVLKTCIYTHNTLLLYKTKNSPIVTRIYTSKSQVCNRKGKLQDQQDGSVVKSTFCTSLMTRVQYLETPHPKRLEAAVAGILDHSPPSSRTGLDMVAATPGFHVATRDPTAGPHACDLNHLPSQAPGTDL